MYIDVSIQMKRFTLEETCAKLQTHATNVGAIVTFTGMVRKDAATREVQAIWLEHYETMTQNSIRSRFERARKRFSICAGCVIHRIGLLAVDEPIVLVAIAAEHRKDAFAACEYMIDYLKNEVPIWKKEMTKQGEHWVESKHSDQHALVKWQ